MIKRYIFIILSLISFNIYAFEDKILVASTTSTYDTGLLSFLNNIFQNYYDIDVQVLAVGTGQAIRIAEDGNVEILLVHHKESELEFMNKGFGIERYDLMYNEYIIAGPKEDNIPCLDINLKLSEIFKNNYTFISRGDDSGTHKKELELWQSINKNPTTFGLWYLNIGQGMGHTLLIANEKKAYTLTDRSTWISFNNKDNLKIVCEAFPPLFNQYGLILVNPSINKDLNIKSASKYVEWLLSDEAKNLINSFKKKNKQLFFYNHH